MRTRLSQSVPWLFKIDMGGMLDGAQRENKGAEKG